MTEKELEELHPKGATRAGPEYVNGRWDNPRIEGAVVGYSTGNYSSSSYIKVRIRGGAQRWIRVDTVEPVSSNAVWV